MVHAHAYLSYRARGASRVAAQWMAQKLESATVLRRYGRDAGGDWARVADGRGWLSALPISAALSKWIVCAGLDVWARLLRSLNGRRGELPVGSGIISRAARGARIGADGRGGRSGRIAAVV